MRILIISAHPHYAGTYCAGTVYKHTQAGDEVHVASITDGELMCNLVTPAELSKINRAEAHESAELLGIKSIRFLGFKDADIKNTPELRLVLSNTIRDVKPDIVVTHWPQDTHPDFREAGQAAIDACFFALLVSGKWTETLPSHWTGKAYAFQYPGLSLDFQPTLLVNVTDVADVKIKSMDCFKIHVRANFGGDFEKYHSSIIGPSRYWGIEGGVLYAEPFAQIKIHEVHNKAVERLIP